MEKYIQLKPIRETKADFDRLEAALVKIFREEIYAPAMRELGEPSRTLQNANDYADSAVIWALRGGQITYNRGSFSGRFNSAISKELRSLGARWDGKHGTWNVSQSSLPIEIRNAISGSAGVFARKIDAIEKRLAQILPEEIAGKLNAAKYFDASLWKTDKEFRSTLEKITVAPQLSDEARKRIADEWQNNMRLYVKDFTEQEIGKLRAELKESVFAGNRYESAVKTIQKSYGVSTNKAKFLARQETALLMAKFKETRYKDAGINEYRWECVNGSANHPVRPQHKKLAELSKAGKIFKWDDPPVTTEPGQPERRNNPGEDYNCRCFAKPVVRFKKG
jgi:SPP1 gp7 family putative phage head morphogenesis protein